MPDRSDKKQIVAYLSEKNIWVGNFKSENPTLYELEWNGFDPSEAFAYIKKTFKAESLRVILGYEFSYTVCFEALSHTLEREHILEAAKTVIPEDISGHDYYWKVVSSDEKKKTSLVQLIALIPGILNNLSYAAQKNKLQLEFITPIESALGQTTVNDEHPKLIIWGDLEKVVVIAGNGIVYVSDDITYRSDKVLTDLVAFARKNYSLKLSTAVLDWHQKHLQSINSDRVESDKEPKFPAQWKIEIRQLDPLQLVADSPVSASMHQGPLEIKPIENPTEPQSLAEHVEHVQEVEQPPVSDTKQPVFATTQVTEDEKESDTTDRSNGDDTNDDDDEAPQKEVVFRLNKTLLFGIGAFLLVFVLIGIGSFVYTNVMQREVEPSPTPVAVSPSPTPEPSPDLTTYKIQVLNGTATAGLAGETGDELESVGFTEVAAGNADGSDYEETIIAVKKEVPESVRAVLVSTLSAYQITVDESLAEDNDYDIIITLGNLLAEEAE